MTQSTHRSPRWGWIVLAVLGGLLLLVGVCGLGTFVGIGFARPVEDPYGGSGSKIALVRVEGVIVSGRHDISPLYGSVAASETIVEQLDRATERSSVVAVLLQVNSPGGGVVPSDQIYRAVRRVQEAGKPVVVAMGETAASGGYYISASADHIVANPHTTTGSIGVIMTILNVEDLYDKLGLEEEVIKSAQHKDMGSSTRPLSEEEREILQALVDETYEAFVKIVAEGREMPLEEVRALADGRIYSGQSAWDNGLVDELGGTLEAVAAARELSGAPDARLVAPPEPSLMEILLGAIGPAPTPDLRTLLALDQPLQLQYLLVP